MQLPAAPRRTRSLRRPRALPGLSLCLVGLLLLLTCAAAAAAAATVTKGTAEGGGGAKPVESLQSRARRRAVAFALRDAEDRQQQQGTDGGEEGTEGNEGDEEAEQRLMAGFEPREQGVVYYELGRVFTVRVCACVEAISGVSCCVVRPSARARQRPPIHYNHDWAQNPPKPHNSHPPTPTHITGGPLR